MDKDGIKKLAELSRLELTESEIDSYSSEFSDILEYVDSLKKAVDKSSDDLVLESSSNRNILREDIEHQQSGQNTEKLIESAPDSDNNYIKVKKIL